MKTILDGRINNYDEYKIFLRLNKKYKFIINYYIKTSKNYEGKNKNPIFVWNIKTHFKI